MQQIKGRIWQLEIQLPWIFHLSVLNMLVPNRLSIRACHSITMNTIYWVENDICLRYPQFWFKWWLPCFRVRASERLWSLAPSTGRNGPRLPVVELIYVSYVYIRKHNVTPYHWLHKECFAFTCFVAGSITMRPPLLHVNIFHSMNNISTFSILNWVKKTPAAETTHCNNTIYRIQQCQ